MKKFILFMFTFCFSFIVHTKAQDTLQSSKYVGIHLLEYTNDDKLIDLMLVIPRLAQQGVNLIILEVDYHFDFKSHPELRQSNNVITFEVAQEFAKVCKKNGIRIIPQFQSLGHQSWAQYTWALLSKYPELDLTPGAYPNNQGIYCREWDPMNPRVNEIVFPMIDEIVKAFNADGLHIGLDEVFLIQSEYAKSTKHLNPASVFAKVVNDFHDYYTKEKGLQLFIWADRLIDGKVYQYGEWESSLNGTAAAIDSIPNDVVLCDWHYEPREEYGSIPYFLSKGFRVLPCSHKKLDAVEDLINYSYAQNDANMLGHLFTTWHEVKPDSLVEYAPLLKGLKVMQAKKFYKVQISSQLVLQKKEVQVQLTTTHPSLKIRYTLNGEEPQFYSSQYVAPIVINHSCTIKAAVFNGDSLAGKVAMKEFMMHEGLGNEIYSVPNPSSKYAAVNGVSTLLNGVEGSNSFSDGQWVGYEGKDVELVIDFKSPKTLKTLKLRFMNDPNSWIYPAASMQVLQSSDGRMYNLAHEKEQIKKEGQMVTEVLNLNITTRYLKIRIKPTVIPEGKQGAGNKAWFFIDELVFE
jgi:hypothetical protein